MRKLASIQKVAEVIPIEGADSICGYRINGWKVVDSIGKYEVGDLVIYCEPDSWIPTELAPFLSKGKEPREYKGVKGEKLRTVRLRGFLSQGLLLPISLLGRPEETFAINEDSIGADVSEELGIVKWEPPEDFINADCKGNFPSFIPKTDQERIQNCYDKVKLKLEQGVQFYVQEKVEGQSFTVYLYNGEFGVCSRNLELKDSDNTFWNNARKYKLEEKLRKLGKNLAIQAEQCGPGISGNIYGLREYELYVFDVFDIDKQEYLSVYDLYSFCKDNDLNAAPALFKHIGSLSLDDMLVLADGKSVLGFTNTLREGLVWRQVGDERFTFKTVSNKYLLKQKG